MSATLLGRHAGPAVSGWLVGFPFTSAPVSVFLTVEQGSVFAADAAVGSIVSVIGQAAFAMGYVAVRRRGWVAGTAAGTIAFLVVGVAMHALALPTIVVTGVAAALLAVGLGTMPADRVRPTRRAGPDGLLLRAVIATALVVAITGVAPLLGPLASGIASGFPLYATVLTVFAHRSDGADAAAGVMRGLVAGLFGFTSFFLVIVLALVPLGPVAAFSLATLAVLTVQAVALALLRRER